MYGFDSKNKYIEVRVLFFVSRLTDSRMNQCVGQILKNFKMWPKQKQNENCIGVSRVSPQNRPIAKVNMAPCSFA